MPDLNPRTEFQLWRLRRFLSRNLLYLISLALLSVSLFFFIKAESYRQSLARPDASKTETDG